MFVLLNLNMPKPKWEGAEGPNINNFFKFESRKLKSEPIYIHRTEVKNQQHIMI